MIRKRFVKNLFQVVTWVGAELIYILPFFLGIFITDDKIDRAFCLIFVPVIVIVTFLIEFYWIFQFVVIDEYGLSLFFLKKKIKQINWENVLSVEKTCINRHSYYSFTIKDEKNFNVNCRKSIKIAVLHYAPQNIKEDILKYKNGPIESLV